MFLQFPLQDGLELVSGRKLVRFKLSVADFILVDPFIFAQLNADLLELLFELADFGVNFLDFLEFRQQEVQALDLVIFLFLRDDSILRKLVLKTLVGLFQGFYVLLGGDKVPLHSLLLRGDCWQDQFLAGDQLCVTLQVEPPNRHALHVLTLLYEAVDLSV